MIVLLLLPVVVEREDLVFDSMSSVLVVGISNVPSTVEDFVVVFSLWCVDLTIGVGVVDISEAVDVAVRLLNFVGIIADAEFSSNSIIDSLSVVFCNGVKNCEGGSPGIAAMAISAKAAWHLHCWP